MDAIVATDETDSSGTYLFEDLPNGSYVVYVDETDPDFPTNVTQTADPDTNMATIDGRVLLGTDGLPDVFVMLYADSNGNGILDSGVDPVIAATATDMDGNYLFALLNAGSYFVDIDDASLPDSGLAISSGDPSSSLITLVDRTSSSHTLNDTVYESGSGYALGDRIWSDADGDGVQDAGEAGIGGVDVTVTGGSCSPSCSATTDSSGFWIITGLSSGAYLATVDADDLTGGFMSTTGGNSQSRTIAAADIIDADFGYRYNDDGNITTEDAGDPTGAITGCVFLDGDGDETLDSGEELSGTTVNLFDNGGNLVATTSTDSSGNYSFDGVAIGKYSVQAVDANGIRYSTIFLSAGETFSNLNVIYGAVRQDTADNTGSLSVSGAYDDLMQDFGYQRFRGSIGDTVYQDVNENSDQDFGEPGIGGVTVNLRLWQDANDDGIIDTGELTPYQTSTTTTDNPDTDVDESGKYLFTNLTDPPAGWDYVVEVDTTTLPGTFTLIADPDTDGVPCDPVSPSAVCDGRQAVTAFIPGINYLGADFGYSITGSDYGSFGDTLWVDTNGNDSKDTGEIGVPYITVFIDDNDNGALDEGELQVETDAGGYYVFTGLADSPASTPYNVRVLTSDPDWPTGLPTTPVYEQGATKDNNVSVFISGGVVTEIENSSCSDCDLDVDFGYQYAGGNTLYGTICIDDTSLNGYCGSTATTHSGIDTGNESPISGIQVAFYQWTDGDSDNEAWAADGTLDTGDTFTLLGSTSTDSNGDYSYTNLPGDIIVVIGVPSSSSLDLSTTAGNTSVEDANVLTHQFYEKTDIYDGETVSVLARQALDISGDTDNAIWDLDFAFAGVLPAGVEGYDFGDLPSLYSATLLSSGGAQHIVETVSIHLGDDISTETDGTESDTATGDTNDDGVELVSDQWTTGPDGASVKVTASAAGWLTGWVDFNHDGDFSDSGERIINHAVSAGENTISFDVPADIPNGLIADYFARFRIYPEEPLLVSSKGKALDAFFQPVSGEVEDYLWSATTTRAMITSFTAYSDGEQTTVEWQTSAEVRTIGFHLMRKGATGGSSVQLNDSLLPALITTQTGGTYCFIDNTAIPGEKYIYELVEVESGGRRNTYGPFEITVNLAQVEYYGMTETGVKKYNRKSYGKVTADLAPEAHDENSGRKGEKYFRKSNRMSLEKLSRSRSASAEQEKAKRVKWRKVGTRIKLTVIENGIYYLSAEELVGLFDLDPTRVRKMIKSRHLNITNQGETVAWMPDENSTGIYFYGEAIESIYTDRNIYWIEIDKGLKMDTVKSKTRNPAEGWETFTATSHAEMNVYAGTGLKDPELDYWLWDYVFAGYSPLETKSFSIQTPYPDLSADTATLVAHLLGGSENEIDPDHHAVISINGVSIGESYWNDADAVSVVLPFDASLLNNGENTIEVTGILEPGVPSSIFYIDSFDLTYPRLYQADGNMLTFKGDENSVVTISNFKTPEIFVLDVTNPHRPRMVAADSVKQSDDSYSVSIEPASPDTVYVAADVQGILPVTELVADEPSELKLVENQFDYLLISPLELMEAAQALADYRLSDGLEPVVIDLEDIMDEFNHGIFSPWAIRDFLSYAYKEWEKRPTYVVLVGAGTYDYKNYMGLGGNLIPPMMVTSPDGIMPADSRFADVLNDDGVPEMAIGRIPVFTAQELYAYIDKVAAYEHNAQSNLNSRVLLVADDPDKGGNFPSDSDELIAILPPSYSWEKISLSDMSLQDARTNFFNSLDGAGFVNYIGHGRMDRLTDEGLLLVGDVANLTNYGMYPVMTLMTCWTGRFDFPGFTSLAESLVLKPDAGAAAVWTSSGLSVNSKAKILIEGFFRKVFVKGDPILGPAVLKTLETSSQTIGDDYMLDMYNLFGDPALRLK